MTTFFNEPGSVAADVVLEKVDEDDDDDGGGNEEVERAPAVLSKKVKISGKIPTFALEKKPCWIL
jgi:hypothetical protein